LAEERKDLTYFIPVCVCVCVGMCGCLGMFFFLPWPPTINCHVSSSDDPGNDGNSCNQSVPLSEVDTVNVTSWSLTVLLLSTRLTLGEERVVASLHIIGWV